jgi:hypothetical protein
MTVVASDVPTASRRPAEAVGVVSAPASALARLPFIVASTAWLVAHLCRYPA